MRCIRRRQNGFTLVEVLVATSMLALIMVALGTSLRTTAQTETRIAQRISASDDMRVVVTFLRNILGRASSRRVTSSAGQPPTVYFKGGADSMEWVGVLPARPGAGGRYFFRLDISTIESGQSLSLYMLPWVDGPPPTDWSHATVRQLATSVSGHRFEYQEQEPVSEKWLTLWDKVDKLPRAVRLNLLTTQGAWPDVVIPVRPLVASDRSRNIFTTGGN